MSIACRSFIFKPLHLVRLVDSGRNTLVYLSYTDKIMAGSPKNPVTAVPVNKTLIIPVRKLGLKR
ncbi:MAG: CreA family protein [Gallionella sp.]